MMGLKWAEFDGFAADGPKRWVLMEQEDMAHSAINCQLFKANAGADAGESNVVRPTLRPGDRVEQRSTGWKATVLAVSKPLQKSEVKISGKGLNQKGDQFAKLAWDPGVATGRRGQWMNTRALRKIEADAKT